MIKPCGDRCICACSYCYYSDPDESRAHGGLLDLETLQELTRQYLAFASPVPAISWQGGEPTLAGLPYFRRAVEFQKSRAAAGQRVQNGFQTCGLLLDAEWARFLAEERFLVGLSIDGPEDLHDSTRRDRNGQPTHARAVAAFKMLREAGTDVNVLTVVSTRSAGRGKEVYRFLRGIGADFMQFIPCGVGPEGRGSAGLILRGRGYGEFALEVIDAWLAEDNPDVFIRTNDNLLHLYFGLPVEYCQFSGDCSSMVTAEADGSIYPCDFFVEEKHKLGNIHDAPLGELVLNGVHRRFARETTLCHRKCRSCEWYRFCHGGCLRERAGREGRGANALCESMQILFPGAFERYDSVLGGTAKASPRIKAFLEKQVRRWGWPHESKLAPPRGVPRAGEGALRFGARAGSVSDVKKGAAEK